MNCNGMTPPKRIRRNPNPMDWLNNHTNYPEIKLRIDAIMSMVGAQSSELHCDSVISRRDTCIHTMDDIIKHNIELRYNAKHYFYNFYIVIQNERINFPYNLFSMYDVEELRPLFEVLCDNYTLTRNAT